MPHPVFFFNSTGKSRRPVRRHFTAHFDRDNVATRQVSLQNLYSRLVEMAEVNRICMFSGLGPVYKEGGGPQEGVVTRNPPFLLTSHMVTSRRRRWGIFVFFFAHCDVLFACLKKMEFFLFAANSGSVFHTAFAVKTENRWVLFLRYMNHSSSLFTVFFFLFCVDLDST